MRAPLLRCLAVLCASLLLGLAGNAVHPTGIPLGTEVRSLAEQGQCTQPGGAALAEAGAKDPGRSLQPTVLPPKEAGGLRGQPGVVFGDLRPAARYAEGHVAGAIHLPCAGSLGQEALSRLPPRARLVLYDEDGRSAELPTAAATALLRGLGEVFLIDGGFGGWVKAGLPAESGPCDGCSAR